MLQYVRKPGEVIVIGEPGTVLTEPIVIVINDVKGDRVKVGIQAERSVPAHRGEKVGVLRGMTRAPGK